MFDRELEIRSSLFYDSCGKNYNNGNVRMANEPELAQRGRSWQGGPPISG
jgi:hypothetical protein